MPDNKIEVEYITTVAGALQAIEKLNRRLDQQETKLQKVGDTSKKTADGAINSFAKLEQTLKLNEKALQNMSVGSVEFDKQLQKVNRLREAHKKMKETLQGGGQKQQEFAPKAAKGSLEDVASQLKAVETQLKRTASGTAEYAKLEQVVGRLRVKHGELTASMQQLGVVQKAVIPEAAGSFNAVETQLREAENALRGMTAGTKEFVAQTQTVKKLRDEHAKLKTEMAGVQTIAGSFDKLESELKDNEAALKKLVIGSKAFTDQKRKVDELRSSMESAKKSLAGNVSEQSGAADLVDKFTTSISGTVATIVSVGAIVGSLKTDLENIARKRENERLAEVDFGTALAARTISNLAPEERAAVKPLALDTANQLGLNPGAVVEAIGELRSSGAADILEAANYLKEAANAFPQDLAAAKSIARAALIESSATGNRNPAQVIGGTIAAQSLSLTKNPEEFAKAFGSNIAASASVYKMTPEAAREEAAIFSLLETRGAEVAADAQRSFLTQVSRFVPQSSKKLKTGETATVGKTQIDRFLQGSFTERQAMIESDGELRKQFFDSLQETGRTAIMRRVQPTSEDAAMIRTVQTGIGGNEESAAMLQRQQADAGVVAAFAISEGQRKAQKATAEIRAQSVEKLTAELEQTLDVVDERTRAGLGGTGRYTLERAGAYVEQYASGQSRGDVLENTLRFRAANEANPVDRDFARQQLDRIVDLKTQIEALNKTNQEGNEILREMLQQSNKPPVKITQTVQRPKASPLPAATAP